MIWLFDDITLSQEAIEKFKSGARQYPKLEFSNILDANGNIVNPSTEMINGKTLEEVINSNIPIGGVSVELLSITGNTFELGTMCAGEAKIDLLRDGLNGYYFDKATVTVRIGVKVGNTYEYAGFGVYNIDEVKKTKHNIRLAGLDNMMKFNKPCVGHTTDQGDATLVIKKGDTIIQAIRAICNSCHVSYKDNDLLTLKHGMYEIENIPANLNKMSCRQVLMQLVSITGCCGRMDANGYFRVTPYTSTNVTISSADRFSSELDEKYVDITGIRLINAEGVVTDAGAEGYMVEFMQNDFVVNDFASYLANQLWNYMKGDDGKVKYLPYLVTTVSMPHVRPLDKIKIIDEEGNSCDSIVTNYLFRLNNSTKIQAKGIGTVRKNYGKPNDFSRNQSRIIEKAIETLDTKTSKVEKMIEASNKLFANAMGIYQTAREGRLYLHDKKTLDDSKNIFTMTSEGLAWTDDGWNGGNIVWKNKITAAGEAFFKHLLTGGLVVGDSSSDYNITMTPKEFSINHDDEVVTRIDGGAMTIPRLQIRNYLNFGIYKVVPTSNSIEILDIS